jgi:hypothetical protein
MKSIEIKCEFCKTTLKKNINEYNRCIKLNLKQFCSLSCSAKFGGILKKQKAELNKKEYYKNPKNCKVCNSPIDYYSKSANEFCGSSCFAKFNNSNRSVKKFCLHCGSIIKNKKFCNAECFFNHKKLSTKISIENGKKMSHDTYKCYLINKNGNCCEMCKITEWGGKPILLILDHINGNPEDYSLKNLRLICSNCDTLTPTYKGKNKGKGRFSRRKKYAQGLSY